MTKGLKHTVVFLAALLCIVASASSQSAEDKLGAWYMYFWNTNFSNSQFGLQGDIQYRNFNLGGDLEQLLLRGGLTYSPKETPLKFTLGYGNITTGTFGESTDTRGESRIYQEALLSQKVGQRVFFTHRFRYEQRWPEARDFATRWRYALFINLVLNQKDLTEGAWYLAFYNELFINAQGKNGNPPSNYFDRNRAYFAVGHSLRNNLRTQFGYMRQKVLTSGKSQLQLSLHHSF